MGSPPEMTRSNTRKAAEKRGRRAETLAAWWLRLHGWRIVGQRVRNPRGEVDLVAQARQDTGLCRGEGAG